MGVFDIGGLSVDWVKVLIGSGVAGTTIAREGRR